jgi:hypothetical protein
MTRPFRFGVVAPLRTDLPAWQARVRRIADAGYSTLLMPDVPSWQTGAWPHAGLRRGPGQHSRGHLGVCLAVSPALDDGVGSALAIGSY